MIRLMWFCLPLILLSLSACDKEDLSLDKEDTLVFGKFYGFCMGEQCIEIFKAANGKVYEDTKDQYPNRDDFYEGNFVERTDADFEKVMALAQLIPTELSTARDTVFGMPDAGDWGGLYLEWTHNDQRSFWIIDNMQNNLPEYLHPLADGIRAQVESLSN